MSRSNRNVPQKKNSQQSPTAKNHSVTLHGHQYSGPIPSPEVLKGFNEIVPGAAERILMMAEENGRHQREIEITALNKSFETYKRGQIFGLIIGSLSLATCIVALCLGANDVASIIGGATIIGLVAVFVTGRIFEREK